MRVGPMVRHLVSSCSGFVHGSRLKLFVRIVEAVLRGRRLTPATVGRNVRGPLPKHGIKCRSAVGRLPSTSDPRRLDPDDGGKA